MARGVKNLKWWKKKADTVFSRYIRLKNSVDGMCTCVTCGTKKPIKQMQNGHFIERHWLRYRYDEQNCHPQCPSCNVFHHGNYTEYAEFMIKEYGCDVIEEMNRNKHELIKLKVSDYESMVEIWQEEIKDLEVGMDMQKGE